MDIITAPFGGFMNFLFALGAVLVGIVLVVWLLRLLFNASSTVARGRNRRLEVVDSLALDPKRQLLIIRRDDVEHLILTGGAHDIVVETGIPVEEAPPAPSRRPIPSIPGRKQPAPAAKPAAAVAPTPVVNPPSRGPAAPATAIEQLREMGKPTDQRAHLSLRHTGLLRPVKESDVPVSPENANRPAPVTVDSAKEDGAQRAIEGTDRGEANSEANRL